jgi:hypothetical protein
LQRAQMTFPFSRKTLCGQWRSYCSSIRPLVICRDVQELEEFIENI